MHETRVQPLVQEDPTYCGACVPQLLSLRSRVHALQQEKPPQWEAHAPKQRVAPARRN